MTIKELAAVIEGEILTSKDDAEVERFYAGDFLSQVMASAPRGCAWFTIVNNINVAGVAVIADIKAIIICEKIQPIPQLVEKCGEEGIAIITTHLPVFECAVKIAKSL